MYSLLGNEGSVHDWILQKYGGNVNNIKLKESIIAIN